MALQVPLRGQRVFGSFLVLFVAYGIWHSSSVLLPAMVAQEGWSISRTSLVFSVAFVVSGLSSPIVGLSIDRFRPMAVFRAGAVMLIIGLLGSTLAQSPLHLILTHGVLTAGGVTAVGVIPQAVYIRANETISPGRALGISQIGLGLGPMMLIPALGAAADAGGWRIAVVVALLVALVVLAAGLGLISRADRGTRRGPKRSAGHERGVSASVARSPATWGLVLGVAFLTAGMSATLVHQVVYLTDGSLSLGAGAVVAGGVAFMAALARPFWGWITDRHPRWVSLSWLALLTGGGILLLRVAANRGTVPALASFVVVFGAGHGGISPLFPVLAEDAHGRSAMGTTFGMMGIGIGVGAGIGASTMGVMREAWGSYDQAIFVAAAAVVSGVGVLALTVRGSRRRSGVAARTYPPPDPAPTRQC